jgi:bifunctional ADP-heptose synthase (sugar kinase/adenylyltransferase)
VPSSTQDETGCGDQVMAALCAFLSGGEDLQSAAAKAILAGTLQFYRTGIQPITLEDIARATAALAKPTV